MRQGLRENGWGAFRKAMKKTKRASHTYSNQDKLALAVVLALSGSFWSRFIGSKLKRNGTDGLYLSHFSTAMWVKWCHIHHRLWDTQLSIRAIAAFSHPERVTWDVRRASRPAVPAKSHKSHNLCRFCSARCRRARTDGRQIWSRRGMKGIGQPLCNQMDGLCGFAREPTLKPVARCEPIMLMSALKHQSGSSTVIKWCYSNPHLLE